MFYLSTAYSQIGAFETNYSPFGLSNERYVLDKCRDRDGKECRPDITIMYSSNKIISDISTNVPNAVGTSTLERQTDPSPLTHKFTPLRPKVHWKDSMGGGESVVV